MDLIVFTSKWRLALVHLEDIVVFSGTLDEQIDQEQQILTLFHNASLTQKFKKCAFLQIASAT